MTRIRTIKIGKIMSNVNGLTRKGRMKLTEAMELQDWGKTY